jgi:hypothetical protein
VGAAGDAPVRGEARALGPHGLALGKGLDLERIEARFDAGVLEVTVPYTEEVAPRKIAIEKGETAKALN